MFNALSATGGAGQVDRTVSNNTNTGIYCTFIIFGVMGGAIVNLFGIRYTICISGLTYALNSASYIYYNHTRLGAFSIATGPIMGIGAGILWSAQGMVMMAYPLEHQKGRFISVFWIIFNLGGVIGGIVPFAINYKLGKDGMAVPLPDVCYAVFVALQVVGALCALLLSPPSRVVREDGSHVVMAHYTGVRHEARELVKLFFNPWILLLIPLSLGSNFFYSYQFGPYNGTLFTLRTRGLNSMIYWAAQMTAAYVVSLLHDRETLSRRKRGTISLVLLTVVTNIMWGLTLCVQLKYTRGPDNSDYPGGLIDLTESSRAAGPILLYCLMGAVDAHYQSFAYWLIGTMTNDSQMLARYAGFYKGIQSLGAVVAWQLDAQHVRLLTQVIVNWGLFNFVLPFTFFVTSRIKNRSDETIAPDDSDWLVPADDYKLDEHRWNRLDI
ncbi:hypothetical protein GGI25_004151 [Coemansia spiralis]|uniref:MFS general substrate transporter n=2 Tax=Coemansia TaxID=4863 RepID=A0A9W8G0V4_9FUNG|nr:hypothetical protein EDC05_006414 [Coemansia umbellata]KAJ2620474.1 hypothetical protein GGI26_004962 [Coemansia sp. RSA 1358]KAJ2675003.1 hypothetical protein GGI25_004151 [Coemansia spiralis]